MHLGLRAFQVAVIPGLLQTPDYASAVLSSGVLDPD
ncbi:Scr1 family TA system antitoxin-like transcriptional regulator, partial [Micromonospora sp. NPDC005215]